MQQGVVYYNEIRAGVLQKLAPDHYCFTYDDAYLKDRERRAISLTLPKTQQVHNSPYLFSFFSGLLAEGANKKLQCRMLKIDENDDFTRLLKTAGGDTIGAITIKEIVE
jgi:serine/threonine-protein kinase HipA